MSVRGAHRPFISIEDYLAGEAGGEQRHDYIDGQVYATTGASRRHGLIANALAYAMTPAARRKGCQLFVADMKVRVDIADKTHFYYPDLLLACDPQDQDAFFSTSPCLLVEQDIVHVELYRRDNGWRMEAFEQGEIMLPCLDLALPVADIYQDVSVPAE